MRAAIAVEGGQAGHAAGAPIGEFEGAEVVVGAAVASSGHGESIAKNTEVLRQYVGIRYTNLSNVTRKSFRTGRVTHNSRCSPQ